MAQRHGWLWVCALCVGCQSWSAPASAQGPATGQVGQAESPGQDAVCQGKPDALAEGQKRRHLGLAAACVERGDEAGAAEHLAEYVAAFPDHHVVRAHYAELLLRLGRAQEAREEFERFIADVQERPELRAKHLVHCHSRLMEIAEAEGDEYAEHLHRGIGLYVLACERADLPDPEDGELSAEGLLCKAAGELTMARLARRDEARPCWYLYEVWTRLDQRQPALRHLREAGAAAPFSYLTPSEKRDLELSRLSRDAETHGAR
jgi:tetratricopeptide (TPR) repeat protein